MADPLQDLLTRRDALRRAGAAGALLGAGGLLAACGGSSTKTTPAAAKQVGGALSAEELPTLGWAIGRSVSTLDVAKDFSDPTLIAATLTLEPLVVVDDDLKLVPWLATLERPDPKRLVFTLRDGVKFTDGSPLTPADVVWSVERHQDKKLASQLSSYLGNLKSVKATGAKEVTLTLDAPDPPFPYVLLFLGIHSRKFGEAAGSKLGTPERGVLGTGMYTLSDFKPDTGLTATRNEDYWGKKPRAKQIKVKVLTDPGTQRLAIQSKDIGGAFDLPLASARQFRSTKGVKVGQGPSTASTFLTLPVKQAPFDDVHVRRAFAYCLNRAALVQALLGGGGVVATSLSAPGHWAPLLGAKGAKDFLASLPSYAYSIDKAKAELAQSSQPKGFSATTRVPSDDPELSKIALSLKQELAKIGVKLDVKQISADAFSTQLFTEKRPGIWVTRLNPVYADPMDYFGISLPTSAIKAGGFNFAGYSNPAVDKLLTQQAQVQGSERTDLLKQVAKAAQEDVPYAPIYWPDAAVGLSADLRFQGLNGYSPALPWAQKVGKPA